VLFRSEKLMLRIAPGITSLLVLTATAVNGASLYTQTNLTSDIPGIAENTDPNLKNPWGMSFSRTSPFWLSNQVTNTSTLYNGAGVPAPEVPAPLVVSTPPGPTGQVFNGTTDFELIPANPARFIFASLSGTVSGWNPAASPTVAQVMYAATDQAVYTGLAEGSTGGNNYLYAADARNGKIDVLNGSFQKVTLAGSFTNPLLPPDFQPYNVQRVGDQLYVTYSIRETPGGYVGVFDLNGNFVRQISDGHLNEPWGLTLAPAGFGDLGGALLVGNEGDGMINGFDPSTGVWLGTISGASGALVNEGLWALAFRAPGSGFNPNALYFAAGIDDEQHGLFGTITPSAVPEPGTSWTGAAGICAMALIGVLREYRRTRPSPVAE